MSILSRREATIQSVNGLHLRAASQFVHLANRFQSMIRVSCDEREANGKSILDLTILAAECGKRLGLEASGPDAEEAVIALSLFIETGFYEEERG